MMKRKVLLLSLGTGTQKISKEEKDKGKITGISDEEDLRETIMSGSLAYRNSYYKMPEKTKLVNTAFVAEILIQEYKPNIVYILGTSQSSWISFYTNFMKDEISKEEQVDDVIPVFHMQQESDNQSDSKTLDKEERVVQNLYDKKLTPVFRRKYGVADMEVKVLFLPNGANQNEITKIYRRLSNSLETTLTKDEQNHAKDIVEYEVSFDITHSFRSLPFYNYSVISYFKQVTSHRIVLKNIYYGMFEAKVKSEEFDGIQYAPVVNLSEVNNLLDLNNAVFEFRKSGNVKSLLKYLNQEKKNSPAQYLSDLTDALTKFDWAIGSNDASAVFDAISEINDILSLPEIRTTKNVDIKKAIKTAFEIPITYWGSLKDIRNQKSEGFKYADNQLLLSKWYYSQHRYSQSICTATEAFRSYLTKLYIIAKNKTTDANEIYQKLTDEKIRANAIADFTENKFVFLASSITEKDSVLGNIYVKIVDLYKDKARVVRNTCAHNLIGDENSSFTENGKEIIKEFLEGLEAFHNCLNNKKNVNLICNAYNQKNKSNNLNNSVIPDYIFIYDSGKYNSEEKAPVLKKKVQTLYNKIKVVHTISKDLLREMKTDPEKFCIHLNYIINSESTKKENHVLRVIFDDSISADIIYNTVLIQNENSHSEIQLLKLTKEGTYGRESVSFSLFFENNLEYVADDPISYHLDVITKTCDIKSAVISQKVNPEQKVKKVNVGKVPAQTNINTSKFRKINHRLLEKLKVVLATPDRVIEASEVGNVAAEKTFIETLENEIFLNTATIRINKNGNFDVNAIVKPEYQPAVAPMIICAEHDNFKLIIKRSGIIKLKQILTILALHKVLTDSKIRKSEIQYKCMLNRLNQILGIANSGKTEKKGQ